MTISWQWVVVICVLVVACVVAAVLGQDVIAALLGGFAGGLLPKAGAVGVRSKSGPSSVALVVALVLLSGCTPAVLVADTTLAEVCDAAGDEIDAEHERGELTTDQAECAVLGLRRACLEIHDRLAESIDEEE